MILYMYQLLCAWYILTAWKYYTREIYYEMYVVLLMYMQVYCSTNFPCMLWATKNETVEYVAMTAGMFAGTCIHNDVSAWKYNNIDACIVYSTYTILYTWLKHIIQLNVFSYKV